MSNLIEGGRASGTNNNTAEQQQSHLLIPLFFISSVSSVDFDSFFSKQKPKHRIGRYSTQSSAVALLLLLHTNQFDDSTTDHFSSRLYSRVLLVFIVTLCYSIEFACRISVYLQNVRLSTFVNQIKSKTDEVRDRSALEIFPFLF